MFGVVPKTLWQRTNPADKDNLIDLSARGLLIEKGNRLVLIDTGMGNKQSDTFFGFYKRWGDFSLNSSLAQHGFHPDDITDVFLTHLHFDHCGGCIQWNKNRTAYEPAFKNALFWTNEEHWKWATCPNFREKASFLSENLFPMQESGRLRFVERKGLSFIKNTEFGFDILFVDGHTDKQMIPFIAYKGETIVFTADLIPTAGHIPIPYIMGFDTRPLITINEKTSFLNNAASKNYLLFLEHDAHNPLIRVHHTEKGVRFKKKHELSDYF